MKNSLKLFTTGQLGHVFTSRGTYVTTILLIGKDGGCGPRTYDAVAQNAKRLNRKYAKAKRCKKSLTR